MKRPNLASSTEPEEAPPSMPSSPTFSSSESDTRCLSSTACPPERSSADPLGRRLFDQCDITI